MGRLKTWQNLNPLFSGKYKKLLEEYGSKDYSKLLLQETLQDYISYNCGHCGHIQRLQAEELNSIIGHAFRLAYAAHLQKSTGVASTRDVIPSLLSSSSSPPSTTSSFTYTQSPSSTSKAPHNSQSGSSSSQSSGRHRTGKHSSSSSNSSSTTNSHISHSVQNFPPSTCNHSPLPPLSPSPREHFCCNSVSSSPLLFSNAHTHVDKRPCSHSAFETKFHAEAEKDTCVELCSCRSSGNCCCFNAVSSLAVSSHIPSRSPSTPSSEAFAMRTPTPGSHVSHQSSLGNGSCSHVMPPTSLPGLHYPDHENNILQSPLSDTSNSPTELNTSKRLGDKPPLIKTVNILDSNLGLEEELNSVLSHPLSSSCGSIFNVPVSRGEGKVVGYANERSSEQLQQNISSSEEKCHHQEDFKLKRISNLSMNSCVMSANIPLEVSSPSNFSVSPPPLPERSDSLTPPEEPHLRTAAWFQAGIPREIALEVLSREPVGAFMVRESTSKPGCYALSLRVPRDFTVSGIAHYLIVKTNKGYKIKGFTKEFHTLSALITHHSVMPELLPCPLSLSRYNPSYSTDENHRNDDDNDEDPDYNTLSDFRKMMADLDV